MFDIGFWELGLIAILALVVLGPKRLPEAARVAGHWVGRLRVFIASVKQDIDQELAGSGELKEIRHLKQELDKTRSLIKDSSKDIYRGIEGLSESGQAWAKSLSESPKKKKPGKKTPVLKKPVPRKKPIKKKITKKKTAKSRRRKSR